MASNFVLNNEITYRNRRYSGVGIVGGFLIFALLCSVGAIANINVANVLYHSHRGWWVAGVAGALIGVVWNYAASNTFVWRNGARARPWTSPGDMGGHAAGRLRRARRRVLAAVPAA